MLLKALKEGGVRLNLKYYFCVLSECGKAPTFEEMRASFECLIYGGMVSFKDKQVKISRMGEAVLRGTNRAKILGDAEIPFTEKEFLEVKEEIKEIRRETHLTVPQLIRKFRPSLWRPFCAVLLWLLSYTALAGAIAIYCLVPTVRENNDSSYFILMMGILAYIIFGAYSSLIARMGCSIEFEKTIKVLTFPAWLLAECIR